MINKDMVASNQTFVNMHDYIHIDEKCFYTSKTTQKYYIHREEIDPYCTCKSKRLILKLMFMVVVARPHVLILYPIHILMEKLGYGPLYTLNQQSENSKNRTTGTLEIKPILSVTKQVI